MPGAAGYPRLTAVANSTSADQIAYLAPPPIAITPGFAQNHNCEILVWFELHETMTSAITREKQIKAGSRMAKGILISKTNPNWTDLYEAIHLAYADAR